MAAPQRPFKRRRLNDFRRAVDPEVLRLFCAIYPLKVNPILHMYGPEPSSNRCTLSTARNEASFCVRTVPGAGEAVGLDVNDAAADYEIVD